MQSASALYSVVQIVAWILSGQATSQTADHGGCHASSSSQIPLLSNAGQENPTPVNEDNFAQSPDTGSTEQIQEQTAGLMRNGATATAFKDPAGQDADIRTPSPVSRRTTFPAT
jgi:uncharacterized protein (DUF927 family)